MLNLLFQIMKTLKKLGRVTCQSAATVLGQGPSSLAKPSTTLPLGRKCSVEINKPAQNKLKFTYMLRHYNKLGSVRIYLETVLKRLKLRLISQISCDVLTRLQSTTKVNRLLLNLRGMAVKSDWRSGANDVTKMCSFRTSVSRKAMIKK